MEFRSKDVAGVTAWVLYALSLMSTISDSVLNEFCLREKFNASCGVNEVIVMKEARYGRLKIGKCIKKNFGYLGCSSDVTNIVDRKCSGKRQCSIDVFGTFGELRPCSELESFLGAEYMCLPVMETTKEQCHSSNSLVITSESGYIASSQIESTPFARSACSVTLRSKPGQRWNISLVDFGVGADDTGKATGSREETKPPICLRYAVIREGSQTGSVVCGGEIKERLVYLSSTNVVLMEALGRKDSPDSTQFLIKFQAVGCADPEVTNAAVALREKDLLTVRCNKSGETYQMTCLDNQWVGSAIDCQSGDTAPLWRLLDQDWSSAYGIVVVMFLGIGLGVIVGCSLLALSVFYHRRKNRWSEQAMPTSIYDGTSMPRTAYVSKQHPPSKSYGYSTSAAGTIYNDPLTQSTFLSTNEHLTGSCLAPKTCLHRQNGPAPEKSTAGSIVDQWIQEEDIYRYRTGPGMAANVTGSDAGTGNGDIESSSKPDVRNGYVDSSALSLNTAEHIYEIPG